MQIRTALTVLILLVALAATGVAQQVAATGRNIQSPQVAVAGTGDFMIVWSDVDNGDHSYGIFARIFGASGKPKGPAFLVHENLSGDQVEPKVAADEQGHFVVVWQGGTFTRGGSVWLGGDGDRRGVFAQRLDRNGTRLGRPILLSRSAAGDQITPNVAMDADGSFVAVWQDCPQLNRCPEIRAARFTAGGQRKGKELEVPVLIGTGLSGPVPNPTPHVAFEPDGFAIGWTEREACYKWYFEQFPVVAHFTDSGRPVGERFRLDDGDCEDTTGWSLAALATSPEGKAAAFFNGLRNSFQLFTPDGDPEGPRTVIGKRHPCGAQRCEVISAAVMDPEGAFAVVWSTLFNPDPDFPLFAQFFDRSGRPDGNRFQVAANATPYATTAAAFRKDGVLIVAWIDLLPDASGNRLLFRQIRRN